MSQAQRERLTLWAGGQPTQDQPTFAWTFARPITARRARAAWEALVARYETLRSMFEETGSGTFACRRRPADEIAAQTFVETPRERFFAELCAPVTLIEGPLARLVVSPGRDETLIGLSIDHLVIDGHSHARVVTDLFTRLSGGAFTEPAPTPADDFYREELRAAGAPAGDKALAYWRRTAGGAAYPPLHPSLSRTPGAPVSPETAHCEVDFETSADCTRAPLTRSAMVLASVAAAIARILDLPAGEDPFTLLLQSSRRSGPEKLAMAGFLSNWQVAGFPVSHDAGQLLPEVSSAIFRSMRGHPVHHAEVVRRLQPELYGARYVPSEPLPPYALFNYLAAQATPRVDGTPGTPLDVPPMGAYRLHGALRIYGTERADSRGAGIRLVADASVFGTGFADAVACAVATTPAVVPAPAARA
ncbi:hypothetical protein C6N75_17925 [Streptomyces solincola]|uniref:Condensation domain-containing protein n=1 Tax=Streptomyces solincola TaxID=2100817 RepID=A0A2S9PTZ1_9ACTN|nr:hypothetical protein C6N75_17925 [Streptomyces solincola]